MDVLDSKATVSLGRQQSKAATAASVGGCCCQRLPLQLRQALPQPRSYPAMHQDHYSIFVQAIAMQSFAQKLSGSA
jgi:hypothetical protein